MNELFTPETHSIHTFKKGDIITRVAPCRMKNLNYNENLMVSIEVETGYDNSFREPMKFLGVANGKIYLEYTEGYWKGKKSDCYLEQWEEGWAYYTEPNF